MDVEVWLIGVARIADTTDKRSVGDRISCLNHNAAMAQVPQKDSGVAAPDSHKVALKVLTIPDRHPHVGPLVHDGLDATGARGIDRFPVGKVIGWISWQRKKLTATSTKAERVYSNQVHRIAFAAPGGVAIAKRHHVPVHAFRRSTVYHKVTAASHWEAQVHRPVREGSSGERRNGKPSSKP